MKLSKSAPKSASPSLTTPVSIKPNAVAAGEEAARPTAPTFEPVLKNDGTANKSATYRAVADHLVKDAKLAADASHAARVRAIRAFLTSQGHGALVEGVGDVAIIQATKPKAPKVPSTPNKRARLARIEKQIDQLQAEAQRLRDDLADEDEEATRDTIRKLRATLSREQLAALLDSAEL